MFRGKTVAILLVVAVLFSSLVTYSIGGLIDYFKQGGERITVEDSDFNTQKIVEAYKLIKSKYVRSTDDEQLLDGAIKGMVEALKDPYSTYMDKKQAQQFASDLKSSFTGIGAQVTQKNGIITVVSPIKDSPAEKVGLQPNDQITKINGQSTKGLTLDQAVEKIRGPKGTKVTLEILRPNENQTFTLSVTRDDIKQETVEAKMFPAKIGYIKITQFSERTPEEFFESLDRFEKQGMKGLIIDVRGNPGGLLDKVQEIAAEFVPAGKPIMMTEERSKKRETYYGKADQEKPYPIAVMIDNGSASASEILAAALNESVGSVLVGEKTFGKGTVQTAIDFKDGSNIKLTMSKWLTPTGKWIDQHGGTKGIQPDLLVKYPEYMKSLPPQPKKPLKRDMNSEQIKHMQIILEALGYSPKRKDGYFDEQTEKALESFQRTQRLDITGVFDKKTAEALQEAFLKLIRNPKQDIQLQVAISHLKKNR